MKYKTKITIKGLPPLPNNAKKHWSKVNESRKLWHRLVEISIPHKPKEPLKLCTITCTRFTADKCDFDSLVYSFKPVMDALILSGIIVDDDMETIINPKYFFTKSTRKDAHITIHIEEL